MARNLFDIRVCCAAPGDNVVWGDLHTNFTIRELCALLKDLELSDAVCLGVYGDVDVRNLINRTKDSLDDFRFEYLFVFGDFFCSKYSKKFPKLVKGCFDCSRMGKDYIDKNTVFPYTYEINLAYSIRDFDVLMGILPNLPQDNDDKKLTIIVEPKLIKKSFLLKDKEHLAITLDFVKMYPNVNVIDTSGNSLINVLREIDRDLTEEETKPQVNKIQQIDEQIQEIFQIKVEGRHLDKRDIFAFCRMNPEFDSMSDDEITRMVRLVLSDQHKNCIEKRRMRRDDGAIVDCIEATQLPHVFAKIKDAVKEREIVDIPQEIPVVEKIEKTDSDSVSVPQSIEIKKYMTRAQYKKIVASSGAVGANDALLAIAEVNLNPLDMKKRQGRVPLLKPGAMFPEPSGTVKKESGCCLVQSIDSSLHNDSKRIVWRVADGPDGLIFVCVGFSEHHNTKRKSDEYAAMREIAAKKVSYTTKELSGYCDVQNLLLDYSGNGGDVDTENSVVAVALKKGRVGDKPGQMSDVMRKMLSDLLEKTL